MKKLIGIFTVAAALAMAMALFGCSSGTASSSASASGSASAASSEAASSAQSASAASESASSAASSEASASASASAASSAASQGQALPNGTYSATFTTDSSMFHVNEANEGKGVLTVTDEGMTIHVSLAGTGIQNLYVGLAADAANDPDNLLQPTTDTVKYQDGTEEEVHGFDIPVPALDAEFDVALIGSKGKWYDHKVSVSDPVAL